MIYVIIILALCLCAAAAGCVYFAQAYIEQDGRKWDLISENLTLEKEIETWKEVRDTYSRTLGRVIRERDELQEKYSEVMCPTNNHLWSNGVCKRCGAWREDFAIIGESLIKAGPKPSASGFGPETSTTGADVEPARYDAAAERSKRGERTC